jgi:hypothetical protein
MNSNDLPCNSPEAQGVDPAGISTFLDRLEPASDIEIYSLMIIRHGDVVAEGWWSPYAEELVHLLYSLSKSFPSTAAAFAIAEWLLDLDATVLFTFLSSTARSRTRTVGRCPGLATTNAQVGDLEIPAQGVFRRAVDVKRAAAIPYGEILDSLNRPTKGGCVCSDVESISGGGWPEAGLIVAGSMTGECRSATRPFSEVPVVGRRSLR